LDPISKRETWRMLLKLKDETFFFVTTNSGLEAESIARTVGIINGGRIVAMGTPAELKARVPKYKLTFTDEVHVEGALRFGDRKILYFDDLGEVSALVERLKSYSIQPTDVEDAFIAILGGGE